MPVRIGAQRPRLSLIPDGMVATAADEAIALAASCGMELDDWQQWTLRHMLGERADGTWAATQSVLIVPRQVGKSALFEVVELAALFLFGERKIIHSAHLAKTAAEHMARMMSLIKANPDLESQVSFYIGNGKESIRHRETGAVLEFVTRGKRTVRGGSPQRVIFDEALFLTDEQMQAILPGLSAQSMNAEGSPQFMFGSSAPLPESTVLHRLRNSAMAGNMPRTFYAEWSCEEGDDIRDRENWYRANPGLGIRISEEWVEQNELAILSPEAFAIERLGIVPPAQDERPSAIPAPQWNAARRLDSTLVDPVTFGVEVSPDRSTATVVAAGISSLGGSHVEAIQTRPGVDWVPAYLAERVAKHNGSGVALEASGPTGALVPAIAAAGVVVHEVKGRDWQRACADFYDAVMAGTLSHLGQDALDAAVVAAAKKVTGDGWSWDRRGGTNLITPLVACTAARWVALTAEPPKAPESSFVFVGDDW